MTVTGGKVSHPVADEGLDVAGAAGAGAGVVWAEIAETSPAMAATTKRLKGRQFFGNFGNEVMVPHTILRFILTTT